MPPPASTHRSQETDPREENRTLSNRVEKLEKQMKAYNRTLKLMADHLGNLVSLNSYRASRNRRVPARFTSPSWTGQGKGKKRKHVDTNAKVVAGKFCESLHKGKRPRTGNDDGA